MTKTERAAAAAAAPANVRVLPQGAGRIFTGESDEAGFATYGRGETFAVAPEIALALEARGLVEITA